MIKIAFQKILCSESGQVGVMAFRQIPTADPTGQIHNAQGGILCGLASGDGEWHSLLSSHFQTLPYGILNVGLGFLFRFSLADTAGHSAMYIPSSSRVMTIVNFIGECSSPCELRNLDFHVTCILASY